MSLHRSISDKIAKWEHEHVHYILSSSISYKEGYDKLTFKLTDNSVKVFYRPKL